MAVIACTGDQAKRPAPGEAVVGNQVPALDHIAIIVLENKERSEVIGNTEAMPYLNELAATYAQADAMFGITHPSLPNYLALLSGDTHGIDSNCTDCYLDAPNLVDQLEDEGISWKAYMHGMPEPCYTEDSDEYVVRHNPFVYFKSIREDPERCRKVVPIEELATDLDRADLPRFIWVTPDQCSNTHDCDLAWGDAFLAEVVPALLEGMGERSVVIVTFDEGETDEGCCEVAHGGHIATIVAGPAARQGVRSDEPYTLYSVLRTIEDSFGLPLLGKAGCDCTSSMGGLLGD